MYPKKLASDHLRKPKNIGKHKIKINLGGSAGRWGTIKKWLLWASILPIVLFVGIVINKQYLYLKNEAITTQDRNLAVKQEVILPHDQEKESALSESHAEPPTSLEKNNSYQAPVTNPPPGDKKGEIHPTGDRKQPGPELIALQSDKSPKIDKNPIASKTAIEIEVSSQTTVEKPVTQVTQLPQPAPKSSAKLPKLKPKSSALPSSEPRPVKSAPSPVKKATPPQKGKAVTELLRECKDLLNANRLIAGKGNTAFNCYHQVLVQDSHNAEAKTGLNKIEARYQEWADNALKKRQLPKARGYIQRLRQLNPQSSALPNLQQRLVELERPVVSPPTPPTASAPPKGPPRQQSTPSPPSKGASPRSSAPRPKEKLPVRPPVAPQQSLPRESPPPQPSRPQPPRCSEIFIQESLGIQPLTQEQREFKRTNCN
jgi:hypothetical protein